MEDNKKIHFSALPYNIDRPRKMANEKINDKLIKYGDYNDFPNHLIYLYNNSSIHATCVNAIVESIQGDGLTCDIPSVLDKANAEGETWNDIFNKVSLDYYLFGGFALEVVYSKDREKISSVYHIDFSYIRAKECDHRGHIPGWYVAYDWAEKSQYQVNYDDATFIPSYNPEKRYEESKQLLVVKPYRPNQRYYPLPEYMGALKIIEVDCETDNYHDSNLKNGLTPSLSIVTYTNATDDDRRSIEAMLRAQYAGTSNSGQLFYMDVASKEEKPDIEPIPNNGGDDYYLALNDMVVQKILTGHRITSPMLLGIKTEGQLGGAQEMLDSYTLFLNMVIKPYQQEILKTLEKLIQIQSQQDIVLGIEQKQILDTGETEVDVVTSKEAESGEDAMLENEIEQDIIEETIG